MSGAGETLARLVASLNDAGAQDMIVGSFASTFHGEPRTTQDIDVVVQIAPDALERFLAALPEGEWHVDAETAREPPDLDTAQKRAAFAGTQAFDDLLVAVKAVDGLANDAESAQTALAAGVAHLDDATTELGAAGGNTKKAAKALATASKKMSAALKKLSKGKAPTSTVKLLKTALQKLGLVIALIRDA